MVERRPRSHNPQPRVKISVGWLRSCACCGFALCHKYILYLYLYLYLRMTPQTRSYQRRENYAFNRMSYQPVCALLRLRRLLATRDRRADADVATGFQRVPEPAGPPHHNRVM